MSDSSARLDELEVKYTRKIEDDLRRATQLLEGGALNQAGSLINSAATTIRFLHKLARERRGQAREKAGQEFSFYSTWQTALTGRYELATSNFTSRVGFNLLESTLQSATALQNSHPRIQEYRDLTNRITEWRSAARRRELGKTHY